MSYEPHIPEQLLHTGDLIPGTVVAGKYRIEAVLGRGGMGAVYRARHEVTRRRVALKWLLVDNERRRLRLIREAQAMGALEHPNVVGVLDVGEHEGSVFLVMELLEGESLRDYMKGRGLIAPAEVVRLLMPALAGVEAAHRAGLIHRDLKPENLFVCIDRDGTVFDTKVLDLGIAKPMRRQSDSSITRNGTVVGTPRYMAPEQVRGATDLDERVDVFALGLITYELLTAYTPYAAENYESLVIEIATSPPPSPQFHAPDLPDGLAEVVLKALAKSPEDRFESVESFARALEPFGEGVRFEPPRHTHVRRMSVPETAGILSPEWKSSPPPGPDTNEAETAFWAAGRPSREPTQNERPKRVQVPRQHTDTGESPREPRGRWRWVAALAGIAALLLADLVLLTWDDGSEASVLSAENMIARTAAANLSAAASKRAAPAPIQTAADEPSANGGALPPPAVEPPTDAGAALVAEPAEEAEALATPVTGAQAAPPEAAAPPSRPRARSTDTRSGARTRRNPATMTRAEAVQGRAGVLRADDF